jgi:hypothetical protein
MAGQIDPLFADHPFFAEQKKATAEFVRTLREEQFLAEIMNLEGEALDAKLREHGLDPDELLETFNKAIAR